MIKIIGNGLLGSHLKKELEKDFEVFQYTRENFTVSNILEYPENPLFAFNNNDIILNAVGAIPQKVYSYNEFNQANNLFPKYIAEQSKKANSRFIHFSSSDVFSGKLGAYNETDYPSPTSIYAHSKALAESIKSSSMVIRTSFIGIEENTNYSLMSWFLNENKPIFGWTNHYWNGLTIKMLAKCIKHVLHRNLYSPGIFHLFSPNILSKYDLLKTINEVYSAKKEVRLALSAETINRTLSTNNKWFLDNFNIPTIQQQIKESLC